MRQSLQRQSADFLHHHLGHGHPSFCLGFSFPSWCLFSLLLWSLLSLLTWRLVSFEVSSKVSLLQDLGRPHHQNPRWHWTLHQQGLLPVCVSSSLFHHLFFSFLLFFVSFSLVSFPFFVSFALSFSFSPFLSVEPEELFKATRPNAGVADAVLPGCPKNNFENKLHGSPSMWYLVVWGKLPKKSTKIQVTASWCGLLCPWPCRRWSFC